MATEKKTPAVPSHDHRVKHENPNPGQGGRIQQNNNETLVAPAQPITQNVKPPKK